MNGYYRAIGFENFKRRKNIEDMIDDIMLNYTSKSELSLYDDFTLVEYKKDYGPGIGIAVRVELTPEGDYNYVHSYPYFRGNGITTKESVALEEKPDTNSFAGICDDMKLDISLIFYIINSIDFINKNLSIEKSQEPYTTTISGLSISGSILLPVNKNAKQIQAGIVTRKKRNSLLAEAKKGNEAAMESLTIEDMDIFSTVSRKARYQDIFTIVDTYFMPFGIESDQYSVMGEIINLEEIKNEQTESELVVMTLNCNDLIFDFCINKKDLVGEPAVGRRFKGVLWLQGQINID